MSLPNTMEWQKDAVMLARLGLHRPPGGENAQHSVSASTRGGTLSRLHYAAARLQAVCTGDVQERLFKMMMLPIQALLPVQNSAKSD